MEIADVQGENAENAKMMINCCGFFIV